MKGYWKEASFFDVKEETLEAKDEEEEEFSVARHKLTRKEKKTDFLIFLSSTQTPEKENFQPHK